MPTGNMSSEPRGCTASNHRLKAIQCCCSVKLMFFFSSLLLPMAFQKKCSKKVLYRHTASPVNSEFEAMCRYSAGRATTPSDLVLLFCMLRAAKLHTLSYKSACLVLQSLCRLTVEPLPPHCRHWLFYCPCLLHCRPRAVPQRTLCCYRACLLLFECRPHEIKGRHMRYS